jgi:flagellar biosynthesis protein FlhG
MFTPDILDTPEPNAIRAIAVMSGKGGTGKSIITASLGYLLSHLGFKTLIIDTDLFTSGISFFLLADTPRRVNVGMRDVICSGEPYEKLKPVAISNEFCRGNLYLIPSISSGRDLGAEFQVIMPTFDETFDILRIVVDDALASFDYVLLDTRGGSDFTSVAAAKAAGAAIIVTEADKTSWDVGEVLLKSIDRIGAEKSSILKAGFILNKNVLPAEAIIAFIRRKWECPHLATIPLDKDAISYFQEDKVPVAQDVSSQFSAATIPIVRKLFWSPKWSENQVEALSELEYQASRAKRREAYLAKRQQTLQLFGQTTSLLLVSFMMVLFISSDLPLNDTLLRESFVLAIGSVAIMTILFTNTQLIDIVFRTLINPRSDTNYHKNDNLSSRHQDK